MSFKEFQDIEGFLTHLVAVDLALKHVEHNLLEQAALVIEKDAKNQIGHYQTEAGPFNAWPELADSTKKDRLAKGFTENDPLERTGALRDSISHEVAGNEAVVGSNSDIMVYQELGTPTIPPRPVLGPAAVKNKDKIERLGGAALLHALEYGAVGAFVKLPD